MQRANLNNNHSNPLYNNSRTGKTKTNSPPPAPPTQGPRPRLPGSLSTNTIASGGSRDIFAGFKSSPLPPPLATRAGYPLCLPHSSGSADQVQVVERTDASTSASNEHENPDDIDHDDDDLFGPDPDTESDVAKSKSPSPRQARFPLCLPPRSAVNAVERSDASTSTVTSTTYGPVATHSATSPTLDVDGIEISTEEDYQRAKDGEPSAKKNKELSVRKKRKTPPPKMEDINQRVGARPAEPHEDGLHTFRLPRPPNAVVLSCKPLPPPPPPPPQETASFSPFASSNDEKGPNAAGPSQPRVTLRKSAVSTPATTVSSSSPLAGPSNRQTSTARARAQRLPRPAALESHEPPAQAPHTDMFWGQRLSKPSPSRSTHALPAPGQSNNPTASTSSLPVAALRTTLDKEDGPVESPHVLPATDAIFFRGQPYKPSEAPNYGDVRDGPSGSSPTADATPDAGSIYGHAVTNESHKAATAKKKAKGPAVPRGRKKNAQGPEGQGHAADDNSSVKKKPVARSRKKQVVAAPTSEESINSGSQGHQTSTTDTANCRESTFPAQPRGRTSSTSSEEIPLSSIYHSGIGTGAATALSYSFAGTPSTLSARQLCGQDCISLDSDVSVAPQAAQVPVPSTLPKKNAPAAAHRPTPAPKRKLPADIEDSQPGPARKVAKKHEPSQGVSESYTQAAEPVSMGAPTTTPSGSSHSQGEKRKRCDKPEDDSEPGPARKRPVRFSGEISYYYTTPGPLDATTTSSSLDHAMDMEIVSASDIAGSVPQDSDAGYYDADYVSGMLLPDLPGNYHAAAPTGAHQVSGSSFYGSPFVASESLGDHTATPPNPVCPPSSLAPAVSRALRSAPAIAGPEHWIPPLAPTPAVVVAPSPSPSPSPPPTKQWEFFKITENVYWGPDRESCTQSCPLPYPLGLTMGASTLNFPPGTLQNPETYAPLLDWLGYMRDTRYIPAYRQTLDPLLDWLAYMSDTRYIPAPR
ncbi:hypothetical protein EXIGLDRAFT_65246 [Exidia glandulosa HHB12029]|uniref:Uncharacterized protein n=1 Tax=Exidia glandulosa HHB12029 TaxID=1314781 RepID=A0A166BJ29_EXIGL|nr:hypothetical protein EXIGLDRAFT_65246 [Exidia glandulosa HHB12029]